MKNAVAAKLTASEKDSRPTLFYGVVWHGTKSQKLRKRNFINDAKSLDVFSIIFSFLIYFFYVFETSKVVVEKKVKKSN